MSHVANENNTTGSAPIYYAHHFLKFVSSDKYTEEKNGFDGFKVRCELLKSRSNKAGQSCNLVFNQEIGFDPAMTLYEMADECNLIGGKNPYRYVLGYQDIKFDSRKFTALFNSKENLRHALMDVLTPIMDGQLSRNNREVVLTDYELTERIAESYEHSI